MKNTKRKPKLTLDRQLLRHLTAVDLARVGAGNLPMSPWCMPDPGGTDGSNQCW